MFDLDPCLFLTRIIIGQLIQYDSGTMVPVGPFRPRNVIIIPVNTVFK